MSEMTDNNNNNNDNNDNNDNSDNNENELSDDTQSYNEEMGFTKPKPILPIIFDFIKQKGFDLKEVIGKGEYSNVYKASWTQMPGIDIACKRIDLDEVAEEWKEKCLKRELIIIKRLKHKNIIEVYEVFKTAKLVFIFMQYATNGSITDFMKKAQYPIRVLQAKIWFSDLMAGLSYMHCRNIAHRDLKLDNFLLDSEYTALLSDFGFAVMDDTNDKLMRETMCGSPAYTAPEVLNASSTSPYDAKVADLYSMGVSLFEMINFDKPFTQTTLTKLIQMKAQRSYRFHTKLNPTLSKEVKDLVYRLLDPNPLTRITTEQIANHKFLN